MVPFVCLFTELTTLALVQLAPKALLHQVVQAVAQRFQFHLIDDLVDKRILQQYLSLLKRYATLSHIEQRSVVQLAYR